jgi:hypothetical protein
LGRVWFRGLLGATATIPTSTVIFTLPAGYRPAGSRSVVLDTSYFGTSGCRIDVQGDGTVLFNGTTGAAGAFDVTGFAALDHLSFDTETVTAMPTGPAGPAGPAGVAGPSGGSPAGYAIASANIALPADGSYVSVPGLTYTIPSAATYQIRAVLDIDALAGQLLVGYVTVNGVKATSTPALVFQPTSTRLRTDISQQWQLALNAGDVVTVQVGGATVANNVSVSKDHSSLAVFTAGQGPAGPTGATGGNATVPMDTWHYVGAAGEPAFLNSWANYGSGYPGLHYRKNPDGRVVMAGVVRGGALGTAVFTLPVGYRPIAADTSLPIAMAGGTGSFSVNSSGTVALGGWSGAVNGSTFTYFDGAEFDTETVTAMPTGPAGATGAIGGQGLTRLIGDGTSTSFTFAHNFNQVNVNVVVYRTASPYDEIDCDIEHTDANTVTVRTFPTVPAGNEYTVAVSAAGTNTLAAVTMDSWHTIGGGGEPAFTNGWVNYSASEPDAGFRKYPDGRVRLKGIVKNGTVGANTPFFTLPAGYRPPTGARRYVVHSLTNYAEVEINTSGNVYATTGSNGFIDLSPIEFDTETVSAYVSGTIGPSKVTTLPANPVDGQEVYYVADAANGVLWRLCYNAASASVSKWEFVGGPELVAGTDGGGGNTTLGAAYTETLLTNPGIVLPLRGDYDLRCLLGGFMSSAAAADFRVLPSNSGGTLPPGVVYASGFTGVQANYGFERTAAPRLLGCPAGNRVQIGVASSTGSLGFVTYARWLWVRPVRVG